MKASRPARGSFAPGQHWYYNNWDFNALGTVYKKFTGRTVFEGLRDDLAGPLEFEDFDLGRDTRLEYESVSDHLAYIMRLSARDLARIGVLMSRGGRWKDRRIVSANWVTQSTAAHSSAGNGIGYGYCPILATEWLRCQEPGIPCTAQSRQKPFDVACQSSTGTGVEG